MVQLETAVNASSIPLGSVKRNLLFFLDNGDSALILVRQPVRNGGPKDAASNDRNIPRFQRCQGPTDQRDVQYAIFGLCITFLKQTGSALLPRWLTPFRDGQSRIFSGICLEPSAST